MTKTKFIKSIYVLVALLVCMVAIVVFLVARPMDAEGFKVELYENGDICDVKQLRDLDFSAREQKENIIEKQVAFNALSPQSINDAREGLVQNERTKRKNNAF